MHINLTHEQADFDALASLLGAFLLDESTISALPRRMNRNVQAFLNLYGSELPFVEINDLPQGSIEKVTLVDTQSIVSLRGMSTSTQVAVIDHHPLRDNLPEGWTVHLGDTGATTTLIIEALQEDDEVISPIHATLLLLGIYEDTGSLAYTRTTPRDLRAAAYLLEQGADLHIATEFLNHPLSLAQQNIYDHLRANAEFLNIHGQKIVIASGDALETDEELSTIAHKLRDFLDPDGLFVLVNTRSGVQMIARSTNDSIDVSQVLGHFGGGGHERASAALVRGRNLNQVKTELVEQLSKSVSPAIRVDQIMSRGAQLLTPDTSVDDAASKMRRFGYEGFPVIENGKVVGLLTRRSVDRALSHDLHNKTARDLMDDGNYSAKPENSIEELQRVMAMSGWGQIPVVQPESGEIIGIVTRTDVIKMLTPKPRLPGEMNLAARLENSVPQDLLGLLHAIAKAAHARHVPLYVVGGFVRDLLLNRPSLDFDLVVEGDAINLTNRLANEYGGRVTSHARFGTAKWHLEGSQFESAGKYTVNSSDSLNAIDLVTARTEFYTYPTALPTVERGSIKLDLHRRDFTVNTLAMRLDGNHYGELHDYWGGLKDLNLELVRVLHSLSFVDDPTRMLRAVRFEQRLGFQIEERTLQLMKEAISLLDRVSGDRLRHELSHIIIGPQATLILNRLHELGLLQAIHPNLKWDEWLKEKINAIQVIEPGIEWKVGNSNKLRNLRKDIAYIVWLIRLNQVQAASVCERLRVPVDLGAEIRSAIQLREDLPFLENKPNSEIVSKLDSLPPLSRYATFLATDEQQYRQVLEIYTYKLQNITSFANGHTLRKAGVPPGPHYKEILTTLRNAWLDERISSEEQENELLMDLLRTSRGNK